MGHRRHRRHRQNRGGGSQAGGVRYEFRTAGGGDAGFSDFFRTFFSGAAAGAAAGATAAGTGSRQRDAAERASRRSAGAGTSFEDILSGMAFGGGGAGATGAFDGSAGGARARTGRSSRTADQPAEPRPEALEAPADLTLEEAFHGTTRLVDIEGKRYEVKIPRGVDGGSRVRLSGKGPGGLDVVVIVRILPNAVYTRRGADLERELQVTLEEALLGAEIPLVTLKGRILLTIPAGTQPGRTIRLKGQGMPRFRDEGSGDLYVKVRVVLPSALDDRAVSAARSFLDLVHQPDPRAT